jgi:phosphatidylserine/phosphatidylglycerophosphate/cardiolipin synthase-like enzyme
MRFASSPSPEGRIFAVAGTNTVSFGIDASEQTRKDLLGFAVERFDAGEDEHYFMPGFKVFKSVIPEPIAYAPVSTFEHPVQSFVWDDFTAKPGHSYTYVFHPLKGKPKNLDRTTPGLSLDVTTEPLAGETHDVFFNRGVASSQAYTRRFGRKSIDKLSAADRHDALEWLGRDLAPKLIAFIDACQPGDALHCCFYEFEYEPVATALMTAIGIGVDVHLIVDCKENSFTDAKGFHESFPKEENLRLLTKVHFPEARRVLRTARENDIAHNKFMVRTPAGQTPTEVWTGSTNISRGGIFGQTNVGHWVRDAAVAEQYLAYWTVLSSDPGGKSGQSTAEKRQANQLFEADVEGASPAPPADLRQSPAGAVAIFSPRDGAAVLTSYATLLDSSHRAGCITLAFGVNETFRSVLLDNSPLNAITLLLLEKKDVKNPRSKKAFVAINSSNNVYKAWGSYIRDPLYQWVRETNAGLLGLNHHVNYVHSKFELIDPLSADPIVVTGSANFSEDSVNNNDENMLVIHGNTRVADIYFTEFNRLFNHYYFRSVTEDMNQHPDPAQDDSLFLCETAAWLEKYTPGKLRTKRLALYTNMEALSA